MKHLFVSIVLSLILFTCAKAQDTIVTVEGDTINCKITRIGDEFIHFSIFDKSGVLLMRSRLPLSKIQDYTQSKIEIEEEPVREKIEEEAYSEFRPAKLRLALNGGFTYQFGGYEGLPSSYKEQLQTLWNVGGELHYFPSESFGLGVKYNYAFTKANEDFQPPFSTLFGFSSLTDERVRFSYMAISFMFRNFLYDDQTINYFVAAGIVNYRTDGFGDGVAFYQEGDTFGFTIGLVYDFLFVETVGMGIGAEVNIARLNEFDNNGTTVPADFSLTRIDLTLGIRLYQ